MTLPLPEGLPGMADLAGLDGADPLDPSSVDDLVKTVRAVRENVLAAMEAFSRPVPRRVYMLGGPSAWDCEQLTFSVMQAYLGPPGDQAAGPVPCDGPWSVVVTVQLVRTCVPAPSRRSGQPDDAAIDKFASDMDDYTGELLRDAQALLASAQSAGRWSQAIADVSISEAQGKYQAVVLNYTTAVGGPA